MKIAVFVDENRNVLPFFASGTVELYANDTGKWQCINQIPFSLNAALKINDLHRHIATLVSQFENCDMLVVERMKGIARSILEDYKIGTWYFKGTFPFLLLDKIRDELLKVQEMQKKSIISPVLTGKQTDASYEINLAEILDSNSRLNSRDILIPFMKTTNFRRLTIICNHLPKWLDKVIPQMRLNYCTEEDKNGLMRITVEPEDFEAGITERRRVRLSLGGGCSFGGCSPEIF